MAQASSADIVEVEWQFSAVDVRPVARWLDSAALGGFRVARGPTKELRDRYLDTADWRVYGARYTCRVRDKGDGAELTLKAFADADGGLRMRREITDSLADRSLDAVLASSGQASQALRSVIGRRPLIELFSLHTTRQIYELFDTAGPIGEIALDETLIPVGPDEAPAKLTRVEVEVAEEAVDRVRGFIDQLSNGCGLTPAGTSKFQAALLATGSQPASHTNDLGSTEVAAEKTTGEVAFAILRKQFAIFLANEAGTRLGEDIEALHDMRVAARRLRAAMQAFRPYIPVRMEAYRTELGWVARALGEVRDLDVQLERMDEWRAELPAESAHSLDAIESLLSAHRVGARRRMLAALDSRRYESLVQRFTAVLQRGPARTSAPSRRPILATAPDLVEARYKRLRKRGDKIVPSSPAADYHLLRIEGKKLRYALEFVGPVYGAQATDFARRVTALQDVLGLHQDAEVARDMLTDMAGANRRLAPDTILAMGMLTERYRTHAVELRAQFPGVYSRLRGKQWTKLRAAMESRRPAMRTPIRRAPAPIAPAPEPL